MPLSPAHATHVWVDKVHTGVAPEQSLDDAHATQVLLAGSQRGVAPEQSLADAHSSHLPALGPVAMQIPS